MSEDVARALEQDILGNRVAFPCGCVLECTCSYPGRDWVRTGLAIHACALHPKTFASTAVMNPIHDSVLLNGELGPLEHKWLRSDATRVTMDELEMAMREWVWRADENQIVIREGQPVLKGKVDPWIVSADRTHLIGRHGTIEKNPWVNDRAYKPGKLISGKDLIRAQGKSVNFSDAFSMGAMVGFKPGDYVDLSHYKEVEEALGIPKDVLFDKLNISVDSMTRLPYAAADAKLTHELLKARNIKPAPYDTPPLNISFTPSWKEWEEAGVVVEEEKKDGDGRG